MASTDLSSSNREPPTSSLLLEKLAAVLPKGYKFGVYHLSTPPTRTDALCSPPPGVSPDKTYRENHFLALSIDTETETNSDNPKGSLPKQTLVLALEVLIFTTAYSTIIFVSKADSTGYLQLLGLPKGTPSPIREVCATFLAFLAEHRRRKGIQTVVSLFARAQSQYLFPGSVENSGKHVLNDRELVKWWCRVLNPLLEKRDERTQRRQEQWGDIKGYLIVPGLDHYETRAFLPRDPGSAASWAVGHPLEKISHYTAEYDWVPPRCLIPRYPDDPKSRFRGELDEEAAKWKQDMGSWKSVKSLDQFWEMMAFRQECSSGRLTGFIWVVFDAKTAGVTSQASGPPPAPSAVNLPPTEPPSTPPRRRAGIPIRTPQSSPLKVQATPESAKATPSKPSGKTGEEEKKQKKKKRKLTGRIIPRQPHIKTHQRNYLLDRPISTAYYHWPPEGRGERIVDETDYKRIVELLLHLDFATLAKACGSTKRWIGEVAMGSTWGREVVGTDESTAPASAAAATVTNLSGLIKRKRPAAEAGGAAPGENGDAAVVAAPGKTVNVLGAGLVRKKGKEGDQVPAAAAAGAGQDQPKVNVLGAGLVRKKPKTA